MTVLTETYTLNNGVEIPKVGFGTWQIPDGKVCYDAVRMALETGYRHIDTAYVYGNEKSVGRAIADSGISRDDIFVTSKLPAEVKDAEGVRDHFERTMDNLGLDVIDMYIIHAPWPWSQAGMVRCDDENLVAWNELVKLYRQGRIRAIGVSNFDDHDLKNILDHSEVKPAVDQIQYYIGATEPVNTAFAKANDVLVEAYSPLATGGLLDDPQIKSMAERYGVSTAQLAIRFCLDNGVLPLPKATTREHIEHNAAVDFVIGPEDMATLNSMPDPKSTDHNPSQH
ncbi:Aldo/keto reductase [Bifidobacterium bohemicum]|uniref:Oxidoreductase n=1 Tax=Bifidobacterium bohemicum DSM 22767 TaxID=1437606 RepID=A0A086ZJV2_9BIFI|nr:aldo/keto reductase [Bifidobacterium bohemicum]KFI46802.1 oxidoreductase [Bifidobacterium bohemicum DSM 22767]SCB81803.1 Aldo/keto reductase [Bifidobacterium bohemicum]